MARKTALEILLKYQKDGSYLNIVLHEVLTKSNLSRQDKDLVTTIVYGTVQNKLYLQYLIEPFIKVKLKLQEQMILLLSVYQLEFLDKIPTYAIIHEAGSMCRNRYSKNAINAILRNYTKSKKRSMDELDDIEKLSILTSHPLWMVKMFTKQYGKEVASKICFANNETPTLAARVNTLKASKQELLEKKHWKEGYLSEDALLYHHGNIAFSDDYQQGYVTIQDESSQLVARLLNPKKHQRVLDMCAAPGSKTTHLSALMENTGEIIACDLYAHKIKLIKENNKRLGVSNVTCMQKDATTLKDSFDSESFDSILMDVPCSGLGVLKRKPEIKYHDSTILDELVKIQAKLLENGYYLLKKGGKMVYSTCTLNQKENTKMIAQFVNKHPDMVIVKEKTILPYEYHSDGFYMCKLEKRK